MGGPAAAHVMRLGCVAAAGCKPFLLVSLEPSGRRQAHSVIRCWKFWP